MTLTMVSTEAHSGIAPVHNTINVQPVTGETVTATLKFSQPCTPAHCIGEYQDRLPNGIYGIYGLAWVLYTPHSTIPFTFANGKFTASASGQVECDGWPRGDGLSLTEGSISWMFTMADPPIGSAPGTPGTMHGVVSTHFADPFTFLIEGPNSTYCENTWGTLTFDGAAR